MLQDKKGLNRLQYSSYFLLFSAGFGVCVRSYAVSAVCVCVPLNERNGINIMKWNKLFLRIFQLHHFIWVILLYAHLFCIIDYTTRIWLVSFFVLFFWSYVYFLIALFRAIFSGENISQIYIDRLSSEKLIFFLTFFLSKGIASIFCHLCAIQTFGNFIIVEKKLCFLIFTVAVLLPFFFLSTKYTFPQQIYLLFFFIIWSRFIAAITWFYIYIHPKCDV